MLLKIKTQKKILFADKPNYVVNDFVKFDDTKALIKHLSLTLLCDAF
jgi:hypothetical protein